MRIFHASIVGVLLASHAVAEVPLPAQAGVSAVLGREQPSYHAVAQADGFRLQNPEHRLSADFTRAAVQVRAGSAAWRWSLLGYGYSDTTHAAVEAAPHATANRVEYRRGDLTEWYLNGPLGLEQGFTLARAPGKRTGAPLTLVFSLSGSLIASVDGTSKDVLLRRPDGLTALRYGGLVAHDATGRELPAWLDVDGGRLSLRVDDTDARYPLVVDPFIQQVKLTASDGSPGDLFGSAAVDGDTLVVGASRDDVDGKVDQGSAYVFVRPPGGWSQVTTHQARLFASDGAANDVFGAVAVSGDTIVVGAMGCPNPNVCNTQPVSARGAAYVFVRPEAGWSGMLTEQAKLTASDGAGNDLFGTSVSVEGDTIVVSADWDDFFRGSAYVFLKPATGWNGPKQQDAKLVASDRNSGFSGIGQVFGRAVIKGDTIAATAFGADVSGLPDAGRGYVFTRPVGGWSGTRMENATLLASDRASRDHFGTGISLSGDTIAVGSPLADVGGVTDAGAAYVFLRPAAGWTGTLIQNAKLIASDRQLNDNFGSPTRLNGDLIMVGALNADGAATDSGAMYVFEKPVGGWTGTLNESERLIASDGATGDGFGSGGFIQDDFLFISAARDDIDANVDQGSLYVFVAHRPARLTLSPSDAINSVGTNHTVTALVEDAARNAVAETLVRVSVTGTVTISDSCMTDAEGRCEVSYAGPTVPGDDEIAAFADTDEDGEQDDSEPGAMAAKIWVPGPPASLALSPGSHTNPVGSEHCLTGTVSDAFGNPVVGVTVRFATTGSVAASGSGATETNGAAAFCYSGPTTPGEDEISAYADTNDDGVQDGGEPGATATKTWVVGAPGTITLTPETATNPVNTEHCVVATVSDAFANPTPDVIVRFTVSGSVAASASPSTDADGSAGFCYMGPEIAGDDDIAAFADTDADGTADTDEPSASASKTWIAPATENVQVSGAGLAPGATARGDLAFALFARSVSGETNGTCLIVDGRARVVIVCRDVTALARQGARATFSGRATLNGEPTTYQIEVEDVADPGRARDSFTIRTQNGYIAGGLLRFGNVRVE